MKQLSVTDRVRQVQMRPDAYFVSTYREAVAFLIGMDTLVGGRLLAGFRSWLSTKSEIESSISISLVFIKMAYPHKSQHDELNSQIEPSLEARDLLLGQLADYMSINDFSVP